MKKIITKIICITAGLVTINQASFAQGFINLNFEQAKIVTDPSNPYYPYSAYAALAIPGWTAYLDGVPQTSIEYNAVALGAAWVSIHDSKDMYGYLPLAGKYSVFLQGFFGSGMPGYADSAAIGQTGLIPADTQSLIFWGAFVSGLQITFDGQPITFEAIGNGVNYTIYGADISAFAGQTGELLFSTSNFGTAMLDNIQFVPEPGTWSLLALGVTLIGLGRLTRSEK